MIQPHCPWLLGEVLLLSKAVAWVSSKKNYNMPTLVQSPWIENKSITRWSEVRSLCPCSSCSPASARCHLFRLIINFGLKFSVAVWIWNAPPLHVSCVKGFGANWWMGFGKCLDHEDLPVPVPAQTDTLMICWHSGGGYGNWEEGQPEHSLWEDTLCLSPFISLFASWPQRGEQLSLTMHFFHNVSTL